VNGKHNKRMQYWGDIVLEKPEFIPQLPKDAVCMIWGYEVLYYNVTSGNITIEGTSLCRSMSKV
jgi:hypothetical protein